MGRSGASAWTQDRWRRRWQLVGMVVLPLLANALLLVYLSAELDDGGLPVLGGNPAAPPVVDGSATGALPENRFDRLVAEARAVSGEPYECVGPWNGQAGQLIWECRTPDAVAVIQGRGSAGVFLVDVTYFGFDEASTDLPAWAMAAFADESNAREAADWVRAHVGQDAQTTVDDVSLAVNGGEGARTLLVRTPQP
jgi:hypothetical protein